MVPSFRMMQERIDEVNRLLREQITGIRVVRAFVREPHETERFAHANDELTDVAVRAGRWLATMFPTVMLVLNVSSVAVLWFGGHRVENGQMEVGALTAFLAYLVQILMSVMMATFMLMMVPRSAVCADRIVEVLDTRSSVAPPAEPVTEVAEHGTLVFDHVEFTYPGADVPVRAGRLLRGAPRSDRRDHRVDRRRQDHDGQPGAAALRRHRRAGAASTGSTYASSSRTCSGARSGWCPQRAWLFSGTVRSATCCTASPTPPRSELWQALEIAQARDFVEAMPEGLDAPITQGGTNVSGGQRQRLAIARALIRTPEIYLFDDSFCALDLATDARLRAALRPVTRDATVLIVAQRVSTISDADLILVVEDGEVVGRGTHDELLESLRDLPGDRRVPAERGGGGMSDPTRSASDAAGQGRPAPGDRADPGRPGAGPGPVRRRHGRPEGVDVRPLGQAADRPDGARPVPGDRGRRPGGAQRRADRRSVPGSSATPPT